MLDVCLGSEYAPEFNEIRSTMFQKLSQAAITCSKLTTVTTEQDVK